MTAKTPNRLVRLGVADFALVFFAATSGQAASVTARVRYRTADGREVEFTDGLPNHTCERGDEVLVLYDPRAPQGAEIHQGLWVEPGALFLVRAVPLVARLGWSFKEYGERRRRRRKGIPDVQERMAWPATARRPNLPK